MIKEILEQKDQILILDCPPGSPRPGDLISSVLKDTGIEPKDPVAKVFGEWVWDFNDVDPKVWKKANKIIGKRIENLYDKGLIRYGEW